MNRATPIFLGLLALSLVPAASQEDRAGLAAKLRDSHWICYSPSAGSPVRDDWALPEVVRTDLELLQEHGFDGVITYGCRGPAQRIPALAREVGFGSIILGIWNPLDEDELDSALAVAPLVDGICVGNEGLLRGPDSGGYTLEQLKQAMETLRRSTKCPLATSEPSAVYDQYPELARLGDWLFPNVHPYWEGIADAEEAVRWTVSEYRRFRQVAQGRPVLLKEVGFPTRGDDRVSEVLQAAYFELLADSDVSFAYFEAFDQAWKNHEPVEPHWGLFASGRAPKKAAIEVRARFNASLAFQTPKSGGAALCRPTGKGGKIVVSGTSSGLYGKGYRLLLFVNPQHPSARGWYLQAADNGIDSFEHSGSWGGVAQLGNAQYPPKGGEVISIAVVALPERKAEEMLARAVTSLVKLSALPQVPRGHIAIARDTEVQLGG